MGQQNWRNWERKEQERRGTEGKPREAPGLPEPADHRLAVSLFCRLLPIRLRAQGHTRSCVRQKVHAAVPVRGAGSRPSARRSARFRVPMRSGSTTNPGRAHDLPPQGSSHRNHSAASAPRHRQRERRLAAAPSHTARRSAHHVRDQSAASRDPFGWVATTRQSRCLSAPTGTRGAVRERADQRAFWEAERLIGGHVHAGLHHRHIQESRHRAAHHTRKPKHVSQNRSCSREAITPQQDTHLVQQVCEDGGLDRFHRSTHLLAVLPVAAIANGAQLCGIDRSLSRKMAENRASKPHNRRYVAIVFNSTYH